MRFLERRDYIAIKNKDRAAHECRKILKTSKLSVPILLNISAGLSLFTRVDFVGSARFTIAKPVEAAVADMEDVEEEQIHVCMSVYLKVCVCVYLIAHCFLPARLCQPLHSYISGSLRLYFWPLHDEGKTAKPEPILFLAFL